MVKSKVLIVGFGGVGIVAAHTLERNGKAEVTAVVRNDTEVVRNEGFTIESVDYGLVEAFKPSFIAKNVEEAALNGPFDFLVVATKNYPDIYKVENIIAPGVQKGLTTVILCQNGIGIEESVIKKFPDNVVLSGISMISSNKYDKTVQHVCTDILGVGPFEYKAYSEEKHKKKALEFISLYANEKNQCYYDDKVKFSRWRKLVYNATFNPLCTLTGVDSGRLEIFGGVDTLIRQTMDEILAVAESDGVLLPSGIKEEMIRADDGIWCTPSMLVDLRKNNFIEYEVIVGNPLKIASRNKVQTPNLKMIHGLLEVVQKRTMEANGLITLPKERPVKHN